MRTSRQEYEPSILRDIGAAVGLAADPARARAVEDAVVAVICRDFRKAVAIIGLLETAASLERLISHRPDSPNARQFVAAVRAEMARGDVRRAA